MKTFDIVVMYQTVKEETEKGYYIQALLDDSGVGSIADGTEDYLLKTLKSISDELETLFYQWQDLTRTNYNNKKDLKYLYRMYNIFKDLEMID